MLHRGHEIWILIADENRRMTCISGPGRVMGRWNRRFRTLEKKGWKQCDSDAVLKTPVTKLERMRLVTFVK